MDPQPGSSFACPRTVVPDLRIATRQALKLDRDAPIPRCWQWSCPGCSHLNGWGAGLYVKLGAYEAAARSELVAFFTLTERGTARSWDASSAALTKLMAAETERLRRAKLGLPRYVAIPEVQKRGAVHWHGLVALTEDSLAKSAWATKRKLHDRAFQFGFGFQADLQVLGSPSALARSAGYLAKYVTKDTRVTDSVSDQFRRVRSSSGTRRWCSYGTVTDCTRQGIDAAAHARALRAHLENA
jgi:hypothetical protein